MNERESIRKVLREGGPGAEFITRMVEAGRVKQYGPEVADQSMVIVASPLTDIDDSVPAPCSVCGVTVWLAPSSQQTIANHKVAVLVICLECFLAKFDEYKEEFPNDQEP